jgi:hypothetical protein
MSILAFCSIERGTGFGELPSSAASTLTEEHRDMSLFGGNNYSYDPISFVVFSLVLGLEVFVVLY